MNLRSGLGVLGLGALMLGSPDVSDAKKNPPMPPASEGMQPSGCYKGYHMATGVPDQDRDQGHPAGSTKALERTACILDGETVEARRAKCHKAALELFVHTWSERPGVMESHWCCGAPVKKDRKGIVQ